MSDSASEKPKIIVDSDWKTQVQEEKEQLQRKREQEQASSTDETSASKASSASETVGSAASHPETDASPESLGELPPASFEGLVSMLATQAAAALGQFPDPVEGEPIVNRPVAKHLIDLLGVLEAKTKDNLSPEESQMLGSVLHSLRLYFVQTGG